ncbi:MAG: DUF3108 domain-containing protein [Nitrospirae bacterium]|nr:DUF3108 domain-containing protein [Nitrospirota bacterium]
MKRFFSILFLIYLFTIDGGPAEAKPFPFAVGEKFTFDITWMGISAGTATLEVFQKARHKENDVYHIISTAKSSDFISMFYPVDDKLETFVDAKEVYPYLLKVRQREGRHKSDKEIEFDQVNHKAYFRKLGSKEEVFDIPPKIQDALSCYYYFRTLDNIKIGKSIFIDTFESKKTWQLEVQALGKERIKTPVGEFDTIKLKPLLKFKGLFVHKGDVFLWVTDDYRKMPVQIKSKVVIGHFTATLIEVENAALIQGGL